MRLLDYSLDNLSMMALILSIGFVVDDAIVMLENIVRHMEAGDTALDAALKGSREIGFTILSMTASLAAVFIPVLFMGGHSGAAVPGIRGDHYRRYSDFRRGLGDADADAVQPFSEGRARQAGLCGIHGPRVRTDETRLRVEPAAGPRAPLRDARCRSSPCCGRPLTCMDRPQGIHPGRRQRHDEREHPRRAGDVVLRDGQLRQPRGEPAQRESEYLRHDGQHRRRLRGRHEHRPVEHSAGASRRPGVVRDADCAAAARRGSRGFRDSRRSSTCRRRCRSADSRATALQPDGAEPGQRGALQVGARSREAAFANCPKCRRCTTTWRSRARASIW